MYRKYLHSALAILSVTVFSACDWLGESDTLEEAGLESVEPDQEEVQVDVEDDSGQFELTNEEGTVRIATGKNAAIPDDFPKDVPLFPGFKPDMVQWLPSGQVALAGSVPVSIPSVKSYYDRMAATNGWISTGSISEHHVASLNYAKDERTLQVTATPDVSGTMISITTSN